MGRGCFGGDVTSAPVVESACGAFGAFDLGAYSEMYQKKSEISSILIPSVKINNEKDHGNIQLILVLTPNNIQNSNRLSTTILGRNVEFNGANVTELNETVRYLEKLYGQFHLSHILGTSIFIGVDAVR